MLEINDKKIYINVFDNITELTKYIDKKERKEGRDNDSESTWDNEFFGTKNFKEAYELLKYGDEKLYNKIKIESKKINIDKIIGANNQKLKYKNNFYGCIPNIPIYLKNQPINMINPEKNLPANKILNIFLNIRVNGDIEAEEIMKIGLKYLTIIDILEKNGYRCNLYSGCANEHSEYGDVYSYLLLRVKTDKEPLNLKKICFTIAHPSMQRRIKFRWMEVNDFEYDFTNGYGTKDYSKHTKEVLDSKLKDNFIVWTYEDEIESKSIEKILEDLKKDYGIKIEGE